MNLPPSFDEYFDENESVVAKENLIMATMTIQHAFRNYRTKKHISAAARIQVWFRAWKSRKDFLNRRRQATRIQAFFWEFQVRRQHRKIMWSVGAFEKVKLRSINYELQPFDKIPNPNSRIWTICMSTLSQHVNLKKGIPIARTASCDVVKPSNENSLLSNDFSLVVSKYVQNVADSGGGAVENCSTLCCLLSELQPVEIVKPATMLRPETESAILWYIIHPLVNELVPLLGSWDADKTVNELKIIFKRINDATTPVFPDTPVSLVHNSQIGDSYLAYLPNVSSELAKAGENGSLTLSALCGIDGVGLGLIRQYHRLGKVFDVWCLHIPVKDRTKFKDLVKPVETTVRSENRRVPNRPIYLVGDSFGGCLALEVTARNSDIDLVQILSNPATSFRKTHLQTLIPLLELGPDQLQLHIPFVLSLFTGDPLKRAAEDVVKGLMSQQIIGLPKNFVEVPSCLPGVPNILPKETLIWKLKMLRSASVHVNSHLHAVKAQTLILSNGKDQLLPSEEEGKRLQSFFPSCEIRHFDESGHFLFLEYDVDSLSANKAASFFRHSKEDDCVKDFLPPTHSEFYKIYKENRLFINLMNPVMLSTLEDGIVVNGLAGIPTEGPVLHVGYHMLMGLESNPMVLHVLIEKNILMREIAHPLMFERKNDGLLTSRSQFDVI